MSMWVSVLCFALSLFFLPPGSAIPRYGPVGFPGHPGFIPPQGPSPAVHAGIPGSCIKDTRDVTIHVLDHHGECVKDAWVYYSGNIGKSSSIGLCKTNHEGRATFRVRGCQTVITVFSPYSQTGHKILDLQNPVQSTCFIELQPKCNFYIYTNQVEYDAGHPYPPGSPEEDVHIVYGYKGYSGSEKTNSYGYACVHAVQDKTLRAVASKSEYIPAVLEVKPDLHKSDFAMMVLPEIFIGTQQLKVTLAWGKGGTCDLNLLVLGYTDGTDCTNECISHIPTAKYAPNLCPCLEHTGDCYDPESCGEMVIWNKKKSDMKYLIYVSFADDAFYEAQANVAFYDKHGRTKIINSPKSGHVSSGFWLIGCTVGGELKKFKKIDKVTADAPDCTTCGTHLNH